ncbi:MAG: hypothetical protein U1F68_00255 [Gammaproteobacteria bacterium]
MGNFQVIYVVLGSSAPGHLARRACNLLERHERLQAQRRAADDYSGCAVSTRRCGTAIWADLLIGADGADPNGNGNLYIYVVFGSSALSTLRARRGLQLSALNGTNGFKLSGVAADDRLGYAVSGLGDVNGDE